MIPVEDIDYEAATLVLDANVFEMAEGLTCDQLAKSMIDAALHLPGDTE